MTFFIMKKILNLQFSFSAIPSSTQNKSHQIPAFVNTFRTWFKKIIQRYLIKILIFTA